MPITVEITGGEVSDYKGYGPVMQGGPEPSVLLADFRAAIDSRAPPSGSIHHSDRGSQYAAEAYNAVLYEHGLLGPMGRRGSPYDNAIMESFMKTLRVEGVCPMAFETADDVAQHIPRFIDSYNRGRLNSALG